VPEYADVPEAVLTELRAVCHGLPDAYEEQAWTGRRWRIRKRTFAHVLTLDSDDGPSTVMTFRSAGEELDILQQSGHPFFTAGWGGDVMGIVLDDDTDWTEVAELVTESYCLLAPKKLVAQVDRPPAPDDAEDVV
jgi:predicted DNA-binding protein (MmcQ/YjbR family)